MGPVPGKWHRCLPWAKGRLFSGLQTEHVLAGVTGQLSDWAEVHLLVRSSASLWPVSKTLSRSLAHAATPSHTSCEETQDTEPVIAHRLPPQVWATPGGSAKIPRGSWAPAAAQPGAVRLGSAAPAEPCRLSQSPVLLGQVASGASTLG